MIPAFELHVPETVDEACQLKMELGDKVDLLAGGTDLFVEMHSGKHRTENIISLRYIDELKRIDFDPVAGLSIGSMVTLHEMETHPVIKEKYTVLSQAVNTIGSLQTRNLATIGGNICTAAPSADGIPPLLVLNAKCVVQGLDGTRTVPIGEFFVGPKRSVLKADEILVRIEVPPTPAAYGGSYFKYGRRNAMEIALQGICVYVETENDGKTCKEARIALATSAPTPIRTPKTEAFLKGKDLTDDAVLARTGVLIQEEARPRSSWRSSEEFRRDLLEKLVPRTVRAAYAQLAKE
ncbi:MAG: FAD binding domain-containing protein [Spirochaetaceae bacterium]|nr:FAD binding domain-containing protein [Spirochaetaceae bacterium]